MLLQNREDLIELRKAAKARMDAEKIRVLICAGTGCIASGSKQIFDRLQQLAEQNESVVVEMEKEVPHPEIKKSGCHGFCEMGPLLRIEPMGVLYI